MADMRRGRDRSLFVRRLCSMRRAWLSAPARPPAERARRYRANQRRKSELAKSAAAQERRRRSREAVPLPDGMKLRLGDARKVLSDIRDNSVSLILTDPPWSDAAEPLYLWLTDFAARVLVPGGALACFVGKARLDRWVAILSRKLRFWWPLSVELDHAQRFMGKFMISEHRPVMLYVKDFRRGRSLIPDRMRPAKRDKSLHPWAQSDGVGFIIEHLTEPGELIIDPFCGTGRWGDIACSMGRRWIGADIELGGSTAVVAAATH
jgi:DNA methylase